VLVRVVVPADEASWRSCQLPGNGSSVKSAEFGSFWIQDADEGTRAGRAKPRQCPTPRL